MAMLFHNFFVWRLGPDQQCSGLILATWEAGYLSQMAVPAVLSLQSLLINNLRVYFCFVFVFRVHIVLTFIRSYCTQRNSMIIEPFIIYVNIILAFTCYCFLAVHSIYFKTNVILIANSVHLWRIIIDDFDFRRVKSPF